jgi:hypothetical protein
MNLPSKLKHELEALLAAALYFGLWIGMLLAIKSLILAEYHIEFRHYSMAVVGALILSKVVLVLEHVTLGPWVRRQSAWVDLTLRTVMYSAGVLIVLILEKGIEGRHEHGGFLGAVGTALRSTDEQHLWANIICVSVSLLGYNLISVTQRHLGEGGIVRVLMQPVPTKADGDG